MKSPVAAIIIWIAYYFFAFSNAQNIRPIISNQIEHHECEICRIEECRTPSTLECLSGKKFSSQSFLSIFVQNYLHKCEDTYFILQNKYLRIYKDSYVNV